MWQEVLERLTPTLVEAVVMAGSAIIATAGIWLARKIAALADAKRMSEETAQKLHVIKNAIEAGVEAAWMEIGKDAKARAADGKLSGDDIRAVRARMLEVAQAAAREKSVELLQAWSLAEVLAYAKKVVQSRKVTPPAVILPPAPPAGPQGLPE